MKMGLKTAQNKSWYRHKNHLEGMTFEDKRDMLASIFVGKDESGKRFGIYIRRQGYGNWRFARFEGHFQRSFAAVGFEQD